MTCCGGKPYVAAMQSSESYSDEALVAVKAGADLIGVHRDTLRRWSDDGRVPVLRTPTGQRRYRVGDLRKLVQPEQGEPVQASA